VLRPSDASEGQISRSERAIATDRDGLAAELQAFVRERLEPYKYPREVVFLDALPRTHLGKVDRGALREGIRA
jgi:acyl-coenzyme A synthetase/AMP-(fatty) acid ligase